MLDMTTVKLHLRVDGDEEDALIGGYLEAAKAHVEQHCDRKLVEERVPGNLRAHSHER